MCWPSISPFFVFLYGYPAKRAMIQKTGVKQGRASACNIGTLLATKTKGGTPVFTGVFESVARVTPYLTDENGLGTCFGAAFRLPLHFGLISST